MNLYQHLKNWIDRVFSDEEAVVIAVLIVVGVLLFAWLGAYLAPVLASIVISFLLAGLVKPLERVGVPHAWSVLIVYFFFVGVLTVLVFVLIPALWAQLVALAETMPDIFSQLRKGAIDLSARYPELMSEEQLNQLFQTLSGEIGKLTQSALALSVLGLQGAFVAVIYLVLVPILVFFLLRDSHSIGDWLGGFLPKQRSRLASIWSEFLGQCGNYARGKVIEIVIVGVVSFVSFSVLGLSYAALLGLLVGLSVIIPFLGAAVVTIPVMLVAYFQFGASSELLVVFIVYQVIQFLDGNVLVPLLFSEAVKIHPVGIISAVLVFGGMWGIWGVFFAIPLATLIKALINSWPTPEDKQTAS
ncbi:MAG: AI-2E family transporter [Gammaproteobacteria bacterium]|nr:AI-2E family transporter [Gammaproteobacteria bacterium]